MNYKTIIMCAVIGASMQNAWGMDKGENTDGSISLDACSLLNHVAIKVQEARDKQAQMSPEELEEARNKSSQRLESIRNQIEDSRENFDKALAETIAHEMRDDGDDSIEDDDGSIKVDESMVGASMQNTCGILNFRIKTEREKAEEESTLLDYLRNENAFNAADKSEIARLAVATRSRSVTDKAGQGIDAFNALYQQLDVDHKIEETSQANLKEVLLKMQVLDKKRKALNKNNERQVIEFGLKAGDLVREVNVLLKPVENNESAQLTAAIKTLNVNVEALRKHNQELQETSAAVENIVYNK